MVSLYKDGDVEVIGKYRGISLGCCIAKVFKRLLAWRLGKFCGRTKFSQRCREGSGVRGFVQVCCLSKCVWDLEKGET